MRRELDLKECGPYVAALLNQTPTLDWYTPKRHVFR